MPNNGCYGTTGCSIFIGLQSMNVLQKSIVSIPIYILVYALIASCWELWSRIRKGILVCVEFCCRHGLFIVAWRSPLKIYAFPSVCIYSIFLRKSVTIGNRLQPRWWCYLLPEVCNFEICSEWMWGHLNSSKHHRINVYLLFISYGLNLYSQLNGRMRYNP